MSGRRPTGWEAADRWFAPPPPGGGESGEAAPPPSPRCEVCGAGLEPDQTYCLECGSPTPLAPPLRHGGRTFAIAAAAVAVVALVAGAVAFAAMDDDDPAPVGTLSTGGETITTPPSDTSGFPGTGPLPPDTSLTVPTTPGTVGTVETTPTTPGTGFDTVTGPATTPPATTAETTETTETEPEPANGTSDWPAGRTAWTAVLSSVRDESDARAAKASLSGSGEPAGVLFSSDFEGLRPGYWVLYSGVYDARQDAIAQATSLRSDYPKAYARRISG